MAFKSQFLTPPSNAPTLTLFSAIASIYSEPRSILLYDLALIFSLQQPTLFNFGRYFKKHQIQYLIHK